MSTEIAEQARGEETEMAQIIRRSASEYRRQISRREAFRMHSERMAETLAAAEQFRPSSFFAGNGREQNLLLLLFPFFETAWADGAINGYEQDAILQAADIYGLVDHAASYREISLRLGARPHPEECERMWRNIAALCLSLSETERSAVLFNLREQAEYVAGQSQRRLLGYWRGRTIGEREAEALTQLENRLEQIKLAAAQNSREAFGNMNKDIVTFNEHENLTSLVPLVKVAWADGQVTKRERHLVFEVAARSGVKPGTEAFRRLESWLELHPTEDFYEQSLDRLCAEWKKLSLDERDRLRFDLLSTCSDLAAASGGSAEFAGGGARVCAEEIAAVKRIAKRLSNAESIALT